MDSKLIIRLFEILQDADLELGNILLWNADSSKGELSFSILCNDVFYWGCADAEDITAENVELLEQSMKDVGDHAFTEAGDCTNIAAILFCARARKERPQGAFYTYVPKELWDLFNACGPVREVGVGNPYEIGAYN